jgi:cytochrome b pre-mRNA-processing protein 3
MSRGRQARGLLAWWKDRRLTEREDRARRERSWQFYRALVAEARDTSLYRDLEVPDTSEGRFEMVALHVALAMRRLRRIDGVGPAAARDLMEVMLTDMDRSVRELGIGDLSVGKYVKRMAQSLLSRMQTLERALPERDIAMLSAMLEHNVYGDIPRQGEVTATLARRLLAFAAHLDQVQDGVLLQGTIDDVAASGSRGG